MNELQELFSGLADASHWLMAELTSVWLLLQLALIVVAALVAWAIGALMRRSVDLINLTMGWPPILRLLLRAILDRLGLIVFAITVFSAQAVIEASTWPSRGYLVGVAARLATAWLVIGLVAGVIRNKFIYRTVAITAWTIAALSILGLLGRVTAALDSVALVIGGLRISPLLVLKTIGFLLIALWFANGIAKFLDRRLQSVADLTPSLRVLVSKLLKVGLITIAILTVLSSVGIDLTALAFLSGAIGIGIGFGLQKVVSNLISGIILLADKSIKPGDVISVGETFGWVEEMAARYTAVASRDGREYLIPNEDLVTQRVINWSHTSEDIRLEVRFGTSYGCDPHQVIRLAIETARGMRRVLDDPAPNCFLVAFGESALEFTLRFWIRDPAEGISNLRGAVLLALWDVFKREGIEIPNPQRDVRVRTPIRVTLETPESRASPEMP